MPHGVVSAAGIHTDFQHRGGRERTMSCLLETTCRSTLQFYYMVAKHAEYKQGGDKPANEGAGWQLEGLMQVR